MNRTLLVAAHGILTGGTNPNWTEVLEAWATDSAVIQTQYLAGPFAPINLFWRNPRLARKLAKRIQLHSFDRLVFVAHSNGCDVVLRTIALLAKKGIRTDGVVLTGSVTPPNPEAHGMAENVRLNLLGRVFAYCSKKDGPLQLALKWPYSNLGVTGWLFDQVWELDHIRDFRSLCAAFITRRFDDLGHCDYFSPAHRARVFAQIAEDLGITLQEPKRESL